MKARGHPRWLGLGLGLGLGPLSCSSSGTAPAEGSAEPTSVASAASSSAACLPATPSGVWARLSAPPCGWELRGDAEQLGLHDLAQSASAPARGAAPAACRAQTCVFHAAMTPAGPVVLAVVPSGRSEMPSDVQLGVVSGSELAFISLWDGAGEPVITDFTAVGPAHALAPFVCGDALVLRAVERLDAGRGRPPPSSLREREGPIDVATPEVATPERPSEASAPSPARTDEGCVAVELPVP